MFSRVINRSLFASLSLAALTLVACNGSSSGATGTLNLAIADTPVDGATSVVVTFTGVEIQPADGENDASSDMGMNMGDMNAGNDMDSDDGDSNSSQHLEFNFSSPRQIDLMQQQGGNSASLLSGVSLPVGHYDWIRLKVDTSQSTITLADGTVHPLVIPSGDETGLKLVHGFTVAAGGTIDFTVDFDLRRSITLANGTYILKPVLRIMDNLGVGSIHGVAANTLQIGTLAISDPTCMPAAYVYSGASVTPVDIEPGAAVQPVTTATLQLDAESGGFDYTVGFLAPGTYTVALACAALDNPATADALSFTAAKNATVTSDMATEVDFP